VEAINNRSSTAIKTSRSACGTPDNRHGKSPDNQELSPASRLNGGTASPSKIARKSNVASLENPLLTLHFVNVGSEFRDIPNRRN
jgi:hypothetical protein